jgi:hypothetical protein
MKWRGAVRWACVRGQAAHKIKYLRYGDRSRSEPEGEEWVGTWWIKIPRARERRGQLDARITCLLPGAFLPLSHAPHLYEWVYDSQGPMTRDN